MLKAHKPTSNRLGHNDLRLWAVLFITGGERKSTAGNNGAGAGGDDEEEER